MVILYAGERVFVAIADDLGKIAEIIKAIIGHPPGWGRRPGFDLGLNHFPRERALKMQV